MAEIDFLMAIDAEGVKSYSGVAACAEQLREWLATPVGSVWGKPDWGNKLSQFKHMPISDDTAAMIEAYLIMAMAKDLPNLQTDGIRVIPITVDLYKINIDVKNNRISQEVRV